MSNQNPNKLVRAKISGRTHGVLNKGILNSKKLTKKIDKRNAGRLISKINSKNINKEDFLVDAVGCEAVIW